MGGFVFDLGAVSLDAEPRMLKNITTLTLTPRGLLLLARCDRLPLISQREILDKSKTDELGKLLACIQATWMVVQVISRIASDMPITLLEVTTLGHVLCALILYALWWHKPRWIKEPTRIEESWMLPLCAFMCMASQINDDKLDDAAFQKRFVVDDSEISKWRFHNPESEPLSGRCYQDRDEITNEPQATTLGCSSEGTLGKMRIMVRPRTRSGSEKGGSRLVQIQDVEAELCADQVTKNRHQLTSHAIALYPAVRELMQFPYSEAVKKYTTALRLYPEMPDKVRAGIPGFEPISRTWLECETEHLVCLVASNWPPEGLLRPTGGLAMGAALWFSSVAFSVVHVAAWNSFFPSKAEAILWRISAVYIGCSGGLWSAIHVLAHFSSHFWWAWYDLLVGEVSRLIKYPLLVVCSMCGLAYVCSRLFLIADAFASLRSLPGAAFLVPQWIINVPHL